MTRLWPGWTKRWIENRGLLALRDRVNGKLRAGVGVAADEDVLLRGLVGDGVGLDAALFVALQRAEVKTAELDALADGGEHRVALDELVTLADERGDLAVLALDLDRLVLEEELHASSFASATSRGSAGMSLSLRR